MAKILYQGTHGTDDPTRASMPFHMALGAVEAGHTPEIGLAGDAVVCIKDNIINSVKGVGMPELKELFEKVLKEKIPIYIWGGCAEARGVSESDLEGKNAKIVNPKIASDLVVSNDRVVTF